MKKTLPAVLTDDQNMGSAGHGLAEADYRPVTFEDALAHLVKDPRSAVVVNVGDSVPFDDAEKIAVFCGASDAFDNYYTQPLPLEDPGDANDGDLDAKDALTSVWVLG